jgi:hypothetical protein
MVVILLLVVRNQRRACGGIGLDSGGWGGERWWRRGVDTCGAGDVCGLAGRRRISKVAGNGEWAARGGAGRQRSRYGGLVDC